jgi:hypothetical protein
VREFRKKPVVIEAVQVSELLESTEMPDWYRDAVKQGKILSFGTCLDIDTLEGRMRAEWTDWIIRGVKGELYPCKAEIFDITYEPAAS